MQDKDHYHNHGRGRNISCKNYHCKNYKKKIGRSRGFFSDTVYYPLCGQEGLEHSYICTVGKNGIMYC